MRKLLLCTLNNGRLTIKSRYYSKVRIYASHNRKISVAFPSDWLSALSGLEHLAHSAFIRLLHTLNFALSNPALREKQTHHFLKSQFRSRLSGFQQSPLSSQQIRMWAVLHSVQDHGPTHTYAYPQVCVCLCGIVQTNKKRREKRWRMGHLNFKQKHHATHCSPTSMVSFRAH